MTQSSTQERLKQIRDQAARRVISTTPQWSDIHFLLSLIDTRALVDSQVEFDGPCPNCGHNNYDAERRECKQRWMEGRMSVVCGCPCAKHNSLANAATQMRTACVEKVKERLAVLEEQTAELRGDPLAHAGCSGRDQAIREIAALLESVTLDQVKQKEQPK